MNKINITKYYYKSENEWICEENARENKRNRTNGFIKMFIVIFVIYNKKNSIQKSYTLREEGDEDDDDYEWKWSLVFS